MAQTIVTVTMPARSIALHPSPQAGVAAASAGPVDTALVRGRVADADANCGDGIEWKLERQSGAVELLAHGAIDNGGAMELTRARRRAARTRSTCAAATSCEAHGLPRSSHFCDTTVVEWTLATSGARAWDLTEDLLAAAARHARRPAARRRAARPGGSSTARLAAAVSDPPPDSAAIANLEQELAALRASEPPPLDTAVAKRRGGRRAGQPARGRRTTSQSTSAAATTGSADRAAPLPAHPRRRRSAADRAGQRPPRARRLARPSRTTR